MDLLYQVEQIDVLFHFLLSFASSSNLRKIATVSSTARQGVHASTVALCLSLPPISLTAISHSPITLRTTKHAMSLSITHRFVVSAYQSQFVGTRPPFRATKIWRVQAEPKCRFFAWLALHWKILRTDNLAIRGWPHDPICKMCHIHPESVQHLLLECSFSKSVQGRIFSRNGSIGIAPPTVGHSINIWWTTCGNSEGEEAGGQWCFHLRHVGMLKRKKHASFQKHCSAS